MKTQISIFFRPYQVPTSDLSVCLDVARAMDEAGIHSIIFGDHLLLGPNLQAYPFGTFMHQSDSAWMDPLITLGAMAGVTKKLKLASGVLISPLRHPVLLAKLIATLDIVSKGRTQLALGVGWQKEEYDALGIPFDERYRRLDEGIRACRAIWGEQPVNFESENIKIEDAWVLPRPVQERVPLLLGLAMTPKNAKRMAELGDGWCPVNVGIDEIRDGIAFLSEALNAAGRDIADQHIRVGIPSVKESSGKVNVKKTLEVCPSYKEAGATIITVSAPENPETMSEIYQFIEQTGRFIDDIAD